MNPINKCFRILVKELINKKLLNDGISKKNL